VRQRQFITGIIKKSVQFTISFWKKEFFFGLAAGAGWE